MKRIDPNEFSTLEEVQSWGPSCGSDYSVIDLLDDFSDLSQVPSVASPVDGLDCELEFDCDEFDSYLAAKGFLTDAESRYSDRCLGICMEVVEAMQCLDRSERDEMISVGIVALYERRGQVLSRRLKLTVVRAAIRAFQVKEASLLSFPVHRKTVEVMRRGVVSRDSLLSEDNQRALLSAQKEMVPFHRLSHRVPCKSCTVNRYVLMGFEKRIGSMLYDQVLRYYGGGADGREQLAAELGLKSDSLRKKISRLARRLS